MTADEQEITVIVTRSSGTDGAVLVMIDTNFEPNASDGGPGLRVLVNDCTVLNASGVDKLANGQAATDGVDFVVTEDGEPRQAPDHSLTVRLSEIAYTEDIDPNDPEEGQ